MRETISPILREFKLPFPFSLGAIVLPAIWDISHDLAALRGLVVGERSKVQNGVKLARKETPSEFA